MIWIRSMIHATTVRCLGIQNDIQRMFVSPVIFAAAFITNTPPPEKTFSDVWQDYRLGYCWHWFQIHFISNDSVQFEAIGARNPLHWYAPQYFYPRLPWQEWMSWMSLKRWKKLSLPIFCFHILSTYYSHLSALISPLVLASLLFSSCLCPSWHACFCLCFTAYVGYYPWINFSLWQRLL